jgi:4-hydroxy-3-polyprenylbenzoate decarboxylase
VRVLVGITGASGAAFAIDFLKRCPGERFLIVSEWGKAVLKDELGLSPADLAPWVTRTFADGDLAAPFSSGTIRHDAFVIVPCSASTMAKIAAGIADTLITRAAAVTLKERMRLVLALRETPLSTGMLENALRISRDGGIIAPIMPPLYHRPQTLDGAVAGFTAKLLALCGVETGPGWHEDRLQQENPAALTHGDPAARPDATGRERGAP